MDQLPSIQLFKKISEEDISAMLSKMHFQRKIYQKSDVIMHKGNVYESLKIIIRGAAHSEMRHSNDKVIKIAEFKQGEALAIAFLFGNNNSTPVDVIANEETEVLILPKDTVMKMISENAIFQNNFLAAISNQTQFLSKKIRFLNFTTIRDKVLHFLNEQSEFQNSKRVKFNYTQKKLSELFGVTRPALARVIRELEDEGMIKQISPKEMELMY